MLSQQASRAFCRSHLFRLPILHSRIYTNSLLQQWAISGNASLDPRTRQLGAISQEGSRWSSSSTRWKSRQGRDSFAREAKVQGLKSRAAFKLLEIDAKYKLFKKG